MDNRDERFGVGHREEILQFFSYSHLPPKHAARSKPFHDLAVSIVRDIKPSAERSVALRKLLESRDAAVRAGLMS